MHHPWQTTFIPGEDCLDRMHRTYADTERVLWAMPSIEQIVKAGSNILLWSADPPVDIDPTPSVDWEPGPYGTEAHHAAA